MLELRSRLQVPDSRFQARDLRIGTRCTKMKVANVLSHPRRCWVVRDEQTGNPHCEVKALIVDGCGGLLKMMAAIRLQDRGIRRSQMADGYWLLSAGCWWVGRCEIEKKSD